ncbi:MAG: ABC transporter substrate-binding protein [Alphaproteobacteria bacterium]|nr:ABC transporter substrate-binding protein [Alphaproteobacteria bacterium]
MKGLFKTGVCSRLALAIGMLAVLPIATQAQAQSAVKCPVEPLPVTKAGYLTMSINPTIPPKQYIDKQGNLIGLHVDLGNEIARRLCLKPEYARVQFEVQIPGLQNKRWDMINTGLYYTEARSKLMQLTPYSVNALALIAAAGNPLGIKGPEDLAGHVVGVEIAGFEEKKLREMDAAQVKQGLKPMNIRVFNTYGETFLALGAGQVEAVFAGDAIGTYYQQQGKFTKAATGLLPGTPGAFATVDIKLAEAITAALQSMYEDGTYAKMMDAYGTTKIDAWKLWEGKIRYYYNP